MNESLANLPPTRELFAKHRIVWVKIDFWPSRTYTNEKCEGKINFKLGAHDAAKNFKGTDFDDVISQMRAFLETLDNEPIEIE